MNETDTSNYLGKEVRNIANKCVNIHDESECAKSDDTQISQGSLRLCYESQLIIIMSFRFHASQCQEIIN